MKYLSLLFTLLVFCYSCTQKTPPPPPIFAFDTPWEFSQSGSNKWYPATVPGVVHTDLLANKLIEDPFWENNEQSLQWIGQKDWQYRNTFTMTEELLQHENIEIIFEGLDTYAEVKLNDTTIIQANNMFREWRIDVKKLLRVGKNHLTVHFRSPISYNREQYEKYPYKLPSGSETKEPRVGSFTRKAAYHFGWDWGPRFVTMGIWRPVKVHIWNTAKITNVHCYTQSIKNTKEAQMMAKVSVQASKAAQVKMTLNDSTFTYDLKKGENIITYPFTVKNPQLWWCNGQGKPHLYTLKVAMDCDGQIIKKDTRYGIRTIELINKPDSIGTAFYFKLNGKPVFMKGANYIPQDVFLPRVSADRYEKLIQDVKNANMNMIRVWGGGIYEQDLFYDLCDKNGILVWQDFMFAGSLYPDNADFVANVKQEVKENIVRLRNHPCIALWCGNNEIDVAWKNWGWQKQYGYSPQDSAKIWKSYLHLFHEVIPEQVKQQDGTRSYTTTSPLSNWGTAENFNHSSMHYWGVWHGRDTFEKFKENVGRFMVEYGFQSFPSMETIKKFASDTSLSLESTTMTNRQKSYIGNGLITKHIKQYYPAPKSFEEFVELSQKTQAKGMQMAIREHMNRQPHCMGTLFWQLNDCWPGPSWSVIDYYGKHKLGYEAVKEEFGKGNAQ
ncbi:hypothetical protein BKI52_19420 [marine bacterium AO1-C]|nr:hypothetical protein BKI52_19420 [marine bacterium AO1-C]